VSSAIARRAKEDVGSLDWVTQTEGRLTRAERWFLLRGMLPMIFEGFRLRRAARRAGPQATSALSLDPPETDMVRAAREYLAAHSDRRMVNHCYRTGFWTLAVLAVNGGLPERDAETAWVAALLHDIGLETPGEKGDFSRAGVDVLKSLAHQVRWSEQQTYEASEAIAVNLSTRVEAARVGRVAWAMNAGGAGELGIWPHRAQLPRARIAELEKQHPRDGFRAFALKLIRDEARRVPGGRFALFKPVYWCVMW
jgi:hypothetical protein